MKSTEDAVFGGGCFWCTEAIFKSLKGVISVTPGYAGGNVKNPSYIDVSSGTTGHAEVIKINYDPRSISYKDLLDIFYNTHNPTTPNRQGSDTGSQYRSLILYTTPVQKKEAFQSLEELKKRKVWSEPVVTEIKPLGEFYPAESYHKDYYEKNNDTPYCQLVISPKLAALRARYASKLK